MILILPSQALVLNAYAVLIGSTPGSTAFSAHNAYIAGATQFSGLTGAPGAAAGAAAYKAALNELFASQTTATLATTMLANLGLSTTFTQAQAEAFLTANAANRVGAMIDLASQLYVYSGTDAGLKAAKSAYEAKIDGSYAYSASGAAANVNTQVLPGTGPAQTFTLTTGVDTLMGTAFADIFLARTQNSINTFNDADTIDGGAGVDTVYLDFVSVGNAITPALKNIETVVVRAQSAGSDANGTDVTDGNNQLNSQTVQIDAQRSLEVSSANTVLAAVGVTQWESSNSRSDVIIEDVRIGTSQKTKDVTIAFRESDPGNVDFGVYFDQHSLRNSGGGTSSLTIQIMDTGAAASADAATAAKPLLNNPYDTFKIGIGGVLQSIALNTTAAPTTAASADTYAQLLAAFQAALLAGGGNATAALGADFTVIDPLSGKSVTGKSIVLTGAAGITFSDAVAGAGWVNTTGAAVPNSSNIYTTFNTGSTTVTELVTSKVILDDVGRGSTGGDLVIGGMSVGTTSTSRGVERFEISVEDSSKLQTINGTNNALREVTIVNGTTSNTTSAYNTVVANAGNLTVNGKVASPMVGDTALVGVNLTGRYSDHDITGFTDVRLIDASAMTGSLAFTAGITSDSIAKYITQVDTAANPFADVAGTGNVNFNVPGANFVYTGGLNNDTMTVTIDTAAVSSRSTVVSGLSDFTFNIDGGAGNDAITLTIEGAGLAGGAQAWYNNQKLNANITIKGGAGNDTVRTPGAGDVIIDLGDGNDTAYTDNTGALTAAPNATGTAETMAIAYANAATAELAAGNAAAVASNTTGFVFRDGAADGSSFTLAQVATQLNNVNLATPAGTHAAVVAAGGTIPSHADLATAITTATTNGGLTLAQNIALNAAYGNVTTASVIATISTLGQTVITPGTANVAVMTATEYDAGNALLETYIAANKAAAATATAADALVADTTGAYNAAGATVVTELLNVTQKAVVAATQAVNKVFDPLAVSNLTATPVVTQGAAAAFERFSIDTTGMVLNAAGSTVTIGGQTTGALAASAAAPVIAAAIALLSPVISGTTYAGTVAGNIVTYTATTASTTTTDPTAVTAALTVSAVVTTPQTSTAVTMITQGVTAATESVAVTFAVTSGTTATAGETITFDGVTHAVGGLTPTQIATLIGTTTDGDGPGWTDTNAGAVVTFTSTTANTNVTDLVAANFVSSINTSAAAGTQTTVNNLAALNTALAVGATDAAVVTALKAAINNGSITTTQAGLLFTAATAIGVDAITAGAAGDRGAIELILTPLQATAAGANAIAQAALTTALTNDAAAVNTVAQAVALDPTDASNGAGVAGGAAPINDASTIGGDEAGTVQTAEAAATAAAAVVAAQGTLTTATTKAANLAALKAAIALGATDLVAVTATTAAVANGAILAADKVTIDAAAGAAVPSVAGTVIATEKTAVDLAITALQLAQDVVVAAQTGVVANLQTVATATTLAAAIASAAGSSGTTSSLTLSAPKAVFVLNTSNQAATYNRLTMDDRNLADLKSDASNTYNFFNSTVKVTYKGIDASVVVAGTNLVTTDLEINQAIKNAINTDAVLSKLLLATDGPANSLVVTSLIDGAQATTNLAVTVTVPTTAGANVAAAATAYGLAAGSTEAQVLAAMATAKTAFDAKGDYVTQFAESGAANTNITLIGANSTSSSDNTITPGTGNDVIVLGTTASIIDALSSSNEQVIYSGTFGADTIVNFAATGLGIDTLNLSALNGRGSAFGSLATDKSIVVGAATATPLTAAAIAALFTDSATAINHVYVAVDTTNIGSIWQVADAAGTAAGGVTATLVGSIDLADTAWSTLTAANFV